MKDVENYVEKELELYRRMYARLFNAITDAEKIDSREKVIEFLKEKQCETEEMYICFSE